MTLAAVPSTSPADFLLNVETLDAAVNSTGPTVVDRLGNTRSTLSAAIDGIKAFNNRGVWAAATDYAGKDLVSNAGTWYVCVVVHTSSAAFATDTASKWRVYQGVIAGDLAAPDGADHIGFNGVSVFDMLQTVEGLTCINTDIYRLNQTLTDLSNALSCVITGDSLSFNGFDYAEPFASLINGGGYATAQPFGMQSWAHMLRDFWVSSHAGFQPISEISRYSDCASVTGPGAGDLPKLGLNVRALKYTFSSVAQTLKLVRKYVGTASMIVSYAPAAEAVLFVVDGVEYNNTTPAGHYQDRGYMLVPTAPTTTTITNVRKVSDATTGVLWIYGTTGATATVPKLTGKGAWTSAQILAEYSTLVTPYTPDVVFYIVGANDIGSGVPVATYKQNVSDFIDAVRLAKPDAIVVLISTPPTSSYTKATATPYMIAARELALAKSCSFIDLWAALEKLPVSYYRFDNIHFKAAGDGAVFNIVKRLILPNVPIQPKKLVTQRGAYMGADGSELVALPDGFSVTYLMDVTPTVNSITNAAASAVTLPEYKLSSGMPVFAVTAPLGFKATGVMGMVLGAPYGQKVNQRIYISARESHFYLANGDTLLAIQNSGLYLTVTFERDLSVLS